GFVAIKLKDWAERRRGGQSAAAIATRATQHFHGDRGPRIIVFNMPAALELGNATGFDLELEDRGALGHEKLLAIRNQLLAMAGEDPRLGAGRPHPGRARLRVRRPVHAPRPGEAGLCAGRGRYPHAALGPFALVRAECCGQYGAVRRLLDRVLDARATESREL